MGTRLAIKPGPSEYQARQILTAGSGREPGFPLATAIKRSNDQS
jgi:hypothetical protein